MKIKYLAAGFTLLLCCIWEGSYRAENRRLSTWYITTESEKRSVRRF